MLDVSVDDASDPGGDLEELTGMTMIDRLIEPGEVTDAVIFLTSPASRAITAVALPVEGGLLETRAWPETDQDRANRR